MPNGMTPRPCGLPGGEVIFFVTRVSPPGFPEEDRVNTLLRSITVLEEWLEDNQGPLEDEVRVRRVKRWRAEAMWQLHLSRA
jgi:hypothetical protein